jgi:hypothetical protein
MITPSSRTTRTSLVLDAQPRKSDPPTTDRVSASTQLNSRARSLAKLSRTQSMPSSNMGAHDVAVSQLFRAQRTIPTAIFRSTSPGVPARPVCVTDLVARSSKARLSLHKMTMLSQRSSQAMSPLSNPVISLVSALVPRRPTAPSLSSASIVAAAPCAATSAAIGTHSCT